MFIQPTPEQQEIIEALGVLRTLLSLLRRVVEHLLTRKRKPTGNRSHRRARKPE
jgi:hypothetical protein